MNTPVDGEAWDIRKTLFLVHAARGGDREALESLFKRYLPRVRRIASLRLGWRLRRLLEIDDIVQDALLRAFEGLDGFRETSEASFRNWLSTCVEREIVRQARRAGAKKRGGKSPAPPGANAFILRTSIPGARPPSPSELASAKEEEDCLEDALLALPEHYRQLIILRWVCGMSHAEIASAMGFSRESTARTASTRALQKLRAAMGAASGD